MSKRIRATHPPPSSAPSPGRGSWRDSAIVVGAALLLRVWHLWEFHRLPVFRALQMDGRYHAQWAESLTQHGWTDPLVYFRAPFYPYFLAVLRTLTGELLWTARVVQLLLGAVTVLLVHRAASRLFPPRWALAAGLAAAFCWVPIHTETELLLEPLLTLQTTVLLYLLVRAHDGAPGWRSWLCWGVLSGLALITRPNILLFAAILPFAAAQLGTRREEAVGGRRRGRWVPAAVVVVGLLAPILPVWLHNARRGDPATVVAWQGGINLYIGNNESCNGWSAIAPGLRTDWRGSYEDAIRIAQAQRGLARPLRPSEVSRYWSDQAAAFWKRGPAPALGLTARKSLLFWSAPEIRNNEDPEFYRSRLHSLWIPFVGFGWLAPLALVGMIVTWRRDARLRWLTIFVLAWFLSILPFFVCSRYRLPIHPPLVLLAVATIRIGAAWFRARDPRGWALLGGVALLLLLLTPAKGGVRAGGYFQGWNNFGDAWSELQEWQLAVQAYQRALELNPRYVNSSNNLGQALEHLGRWAEAERAYRSGLATSPDHPVLQRNLAVALDRQGRRTEAETVLQAHLQQTPSDGAAALLLAKLLEADGRASDARRTLETLLRENEESVPARVALIEHLRAAGEVSEARRLLTEGLNRAPGHPQYLRLAQALGGTGMER